MGKHKDCYVMHSQKSQCPTCTVLIEADREIRKVLSMPQHPTSNDLVVVSRVLLNDVANKLSNLGQTGMSEALFEELNKDVKPTVDPLASEIEAYPAYWRKLPEHWAALDYYRVRELFPLPVELQSARLDHSLKKLLVPGIRTGGKSFRKDIQEAYNTLGQWLKDNPEVGE